MEKEIFAVELHGQMVNKFLFDCVFDTWLRCSATYYILAKLNNGQVTRTISNYVYGFFSFVLTFFVNYVRCCKRIYRRLSAMIIISRLSCVQSREKWILIISFCKLLEIWADYLLLLQLLRCRYWKCCVWLNSSMWLTCAYQRAASAYIMSAL